MRSATRVALSVLVGAFLAGGVVACSDDGDLSIVNNGPGDITVETGDQRLTVDAHGGAVLLDYGCTPGDVIVTLATGAETVLPGPVCPDQEIVVSDGTALVQPARSKT